MGVVYLIQPAQFTGTDRYKIGCSRKNDPSRVIKGYNNGTRTIVIEGVHEPFDVERRLVERFAKAFRQVGGREYFAGDGEAMRVCFKAVTSEVTGGDKGDGRCANDGNSVAAQEDKVVVEAEKQQPAVSTKAKRVFSCSKCNKVFSRNQTLKDHESKCTGLNPLQCPICFKVFASRFGKANHKKYVKCSPPPPPPPVPPPLPAPFVNHRAHSPSTDNNEVITNTTVQNITATSSLKKHRPFVCNQCSKAYTNQRGLVDHLKKCKGVNPLQCPICFKVFASRFGRANHKKYVNCSSPSVYQTPLTVNP